MSEDARIGEMLAPEVMVLIAGWIRERTH